MVILIKYAPRPIAGACLYKLIYLLIDLAINPTHLRDLQRNTRELPGPKGPKGGAEERDKRTDTRVAWRDGPCRVWSPATSTRSRGYQVRWTRRALPALGSCPNLQLSSGEREEALQSVPIDPKLNKAPPVHYYTCAHLSSLVQGTYYQDNTAARARVRGGC